MSHEEPEAMRHERGFSMIELIVAMTVTLIVSSAIYGLLSAGGNAFRREPEMADRQQNIRAALDLIARDVYGAGAAMPSFAQVFTRTDPTGTCSASLNSCGQPGTMGPTAAAARGTGDDEDTDVLEIVSTDEQCPNLTVCQAQPAAGLFVTRDSQPQCLPGSLVLVTDNATFAVRGVTATAGTTACAGGASPPNANLTLTAGLAPFNAAVTGALPHFLYRARVARYMVAPSTDPLDTAPALWRSESGLYIADGNPAPAPGAANSPWQLIARGIEDLQIEYMDGTLAWQNEPPVSVAGDWNTLVRRVRITLSARVTAMNLAGESAGGAGGPQAIRGQLSTVVTPRAAFHELQMCSGPGAAPACSATQRIQ
jgi:type IV pilus assembly protein PilW